MVYYTNKDYQNMFDFIINIEEFYLNFGLLKNAAIASFHLIEEKNNYFEDYQEKIAVWLTAIYSDDIMLENLKTTEWDDKHNFTLNDSIGIYSKKKLLKKTKLENINQNPSSSANISIGAAQRELNHQYKVALTHNKTFRNFFDIEETSINQTLKNYKNTNFLCTDYFRKRFIKNI